MSPEAEACLRTILKIDDEYWRMDTVHDYDWLDFGKRVSEALAALSPEDRDDVIEAAKRGALYSWIREARHYDEQNDKDT